MFFPARDPKARVLLSPTCGQKAPFILCPAHGPQAYGMISLTRGSACSMFTRACGLKACGMLILGAWLEGVWHVLLCAWAEGTCGRLSMSRGPKAVVCQQSVACSPLRAARRCVACFPARGPKERGMFFPSAWFVRGALPKRMVGCPGCLARRFVLLFFPSACSEGMW